MQSRLATAQDRDAISIGAASVMEIALEEGARMAHIREDVQLNEMSDNAMSMVPDYVDGPFRSARIVNIGAAARQNLSLPNNQSLRPR